MIITLIFVLITLIHAYLDARKIKKHEYIDHFWRTIYYTFICIGVIAIFDHLQMNTLYGNGLYTLQGVLLIILVRTGIYSFALNLMRNKNIFYVSQTTTSVIDQWYIKNKINPHLIGVISLILLIIYNINI